MSALPRSLSPDYRQANLSHEVGRPFSSYNYNSGYVNAAGNPALDQRDYTGIIPVRIPRVAPAARTQMTMPPGPQAPLTPGYNNGLLNDTQKAEQAYKVKMFNDWWNNQQASKAPASIPAPSGPPTTPTTRFNTFTGPTGPAELPQGFGPSGMPMDSDINPNNREDLVISDERSTRGIPPRLGPSITEKGGIPAPAAKTAATVKDLPGYGKLSDAERSYLPKDLNPNPTGSPGLSGPRDAANLKGIAKQQAKNSQAYKDFEANDAQVRDFKGREADIADASKQGVNYGHESQTASKTAPDGVSQEDWDAMKPNERAQYIQRNQQHQQTAEFNDQKLKAEQDKQTRAALGDAAKFVVGGIGKIGEYLGKLADKAQKGQQLTHQNHQKFVEYRESEWTRHENLMRKTLGGGKFGLDEEEQKNLDAKVAAAQVEWDRRTSAMEHRMFGEVWSADGEPLSTSPSAATPTPTGQPGATSGASASGSSTQPATKPGKGVNVNGVAFADNGDGTITHPDGRVYKLENGKVVARVK